MSERSVSVILRAEIGDFKAKMGQAADATRKFGQDASNYLQRNEQSLNTLTTKAGVLGAGLTALAGLAVAKFATFDQAMSNVAATGDDARNSLDRLRDAAIQAGRDTAFSATEAAGGIENLAKAGVSAADILGGGLNGALDLAAAGQLSVADASEVAAIAMKQFGLAGSDVSHVADLLAAGAGKAVGDVSDLAAALRQSGQIAAQTGVTIEETTGVLAAFANAGLLGSDAGTSLKTMLQRLAAPSGEAARQLEALGVSAWDASGRFVGLETLAGQLQDGMRDLTPEARNAALAIIFGADSARAAAVLYNEGADGIRGWTEAVNDQGYAAEVASTRLDNLRGDLQILAGSVETTMIAFGAAGDGPLRALVQRTTDVVNALGELPAAAQGALLGIVGGGGLVLLGVAGLGKLALAINEIRIALEAAKISAKTAGIATAAIGGVLTVAALAVAKFAEAQAEARARVEEYTSSLDAQTGAITENTRSLAAKRLEEAGALEAAARLGIDTGLLVDAILREGDAWDTVAGKLDSYRGTADMGAAAREQMFDDRDAIAGAIGREADALDDAIAAREREQTAVESSTAATRDATGAYEEQVSAVDALIDALDALNKVNLSASDAAIKWESQLDAVSAALEKNGATTDITTEAGRANMSALNDLARAGQARAQTLLEQTGSEDAFRASLADSRQALANTAVAMGMGEEAAWALVDSILAVPPTTETVANLDVTQALADLASLGVTIDETSGTVTINGDPAPADATLGDLIGNVDRASGTVTINGNRYPADLTVGQLTAWIAQQSASVTANANTSAAETALNYLARVRYSTIFANVITSSVPASIAAPARNRGGIIGYAGGGLVPGRPPVDPRADNVLATNGRGLFALRSGEYVSTEGSTRRNRNALAAGNRGATLAVVSAGYSGGGPVAAERTAPTWVAPGGVGDAVKAAKVFGAEADLRRALGQLFNGAQLEITGARHMYDGFAAHLLLAIDRQG